MGYKKVMDATREDLLSGAIVGGNLAGPLSTAEGMYSFLVAAHINRIMDTISMHTGALTPDFLIRLHGMLRGLRAMLAPYADQQFEDKEEEIVSNFPDELKSYTPVVLREYYTNLMRWFELMITQFVFGMQVLPEVPVELKLIGREEIEETTKVGEVKINDAHEKEREGVGEGNRENDSRSGESSEGAGAKNEPRGDPEHSGADAESSASVSQDTPRQPDA